MRKNESGGGEKRKAWRPVVLGCALVGALSARRILLDSSREPGPGPEERLVLKDEENLSGVGVVMENMIGFYLDDPAKVRILDSLDLVIAIEPVEEPQSSITLSFSNGTVTIEPGLVANPDIKLSCDYEVLMEMPKMGAGLRTIKYLMTPGGKQVAGKFLSGRVKISGIIPHGLKMLKLSRFLSVPLEGRAA